MKKGIHPMSPNIYEVRKRTSSWTDALLNMRLQTHSKSTYIDVWQVKYSSNSIGEEAGTPYSLQLFGQPCLVTDADALHRGTVLSGVTFPCTSELDKTMYIPRFIHEQHTKQP
jgi:hypothetical protein